MISFDTNILVYAADRAAGQRHRVAAELVERAMRARVCVQTLQSLCEFFNVATRKAGADKAAAAEIVAAWSTAMPIEGAKLSDLHAGMRAVGEHGLSFWDAMLWATARRAGARLLISEDFQDGRTIEGVRIVNPFLERNSLAIERALADRQGPVRP